MINHWIVWAFQTSPYIVLKCVANLAYHQIFGDYAGLTRPDKVVQAHDACPSVPPA
jgi:hypothetical protein